MTSLYKRNGVVFARASRRSRFMPCLFAFGGNGRSSAINVAHRKTESMPYVGGDYNNN